MAPPQRSAAPGRCARLLGATRTALSTIRPGATLEVVNRTTAALYALAGVLVGVAVLGRPELPHRPLVAGLALGALGVALGVHLLRRALPVWAYQLTQLGGTAAIAVGIRSYGGGVPAVADAWLFALVVAESVFFFPTAVAAVHVAVVLVGVLVGLGAAPGVRAVDLVVLTGVLLALALLVRRLATATERAETDPLTALPDRRGTTRRLEAALALGDGLSLALLDLDHFKAVNDTGGHAAGDELLRTTAAGWAALLPPGAVLGRWGGDEFALLVRGDGRATAAVVDALRAALPGGRSFTAGVAAALPGDDLEVLLDRADGALYAAKRARRGTTRVWAPSVTSGRSLLAALEAGALEVHHQPVLSLRDGAVVGTEALVRWRRPDGSLLPPADFLPQAEVSGAVVALGRYVVERACRDAASWPVPRGRPPLTVAVNASGAELVHPEYAAWVTAALARAGLPGERLVLELVEGVLDDDSAVLAANLAVLRAAGVRLAVDDFGTGWSSLGRLGRLPLDVLKVDRRFVAALAPDRPDAPVVTAVLALARALELRVVAEGVESDHQAAWLRGAGCEEAQGWLWAPALPADELYEWLESHPSNRSDSGSSGSSAGAESSPSSSRSRPTATI